MRTSERLWVNSYFTKVALLVALLYLIAAIVVSRANGQTICVGVPVMPLESQAARNKVQQDTEQFVRQHYKWVADCRTAELELVVEPVSGTIDTGETYVAVQFAATWQYITGTYRTSGQTLPYSTWMVSVFPRGQLHLTRQRGGNLQKVVARTLRMGRKQHWLDGNSG